MQQLITNYTLWSHTIKVYIHSGAGEGYESFFQNLEGFQIYNNKSNNKYQIFCVNIYTNDLHINPFISSLINEVHCMSVSDMCEYV